MYHDMDATEFGYPIGQVPRMDVHAFPADETLRKLAKTACEKVNPEISVFEGRVVSGDQFVADKALKNQIIEKNQWLVYRDGRNSSRTGSAFK